MPFINAFNMNRYPPQFPQLHGKQTQAGSETTGPKVLREMRHIKKIIPSARKVEFKEILLSLFLILLLRNWVPFPSQLQSQELRLIFVFLRFAVSTGNYLLTPAAIGTRSEPFIPFSEVDRISELSVRIPSHFTIMVAVAAVRLEGLWYHRVVGEGGGV